MDESLEQYNQTNYAFCDECGYQWEIVVIEGDVTADGHEPTDFDDTGWIWEVPHKKTLYWECESVLVVLKSDLGM